MNSVYHRLSSFKPVSKSYTTKFLFIAFLGIHIPLIGLIAFILISPGALPAGSVLLLALLCTLGATAITLFILNSLLSPLKMSKAALEDYLTQRKMPNLPTQYQDEAGILMRRIEETVTTLDSLLQEKKDLIGLLSHDLRTPLSTILLFSRSLENNETMSEEQRREIGANISVSVKEQLTLFQRILELLRNDDITALQLQLSTIDLQQTLADCIQSMDSLAKQKQISFQLSVPADINIQADSNLFSQVVKNLLSNAIKFSFPGSVVLMAVEQKGSGVSITVKDEGLGFSPEVGEQLFQRFTKHRKTGTANEVSTGMGLYLSKKIVQAHNGTITAMSKGRNTGSAFSISLANALN